MNTSCVLAPRLHHRPPLSHCSALTPHCPIIFSYPSQLPLHRAPEIIQKPVVGVVWVLTRSFQVHLKYETFIKSTGWQPV